MSTEYEPDEKPQQERRDSYDFQFTAKNLNTTHSHLHPQATPSRKFHHPFNRDLIDNLFTVVNRELLCCKLFYFFFFGAFGSLFPLLAIYFKQLGMNASQGGVLIGFRPFIEFLSVPFWTGLADRWRRGKEMLLFSLLCWVVFTLAIAFVKPPAHKCLVYNGTHTVLEIPYITRRRRRDVTSVHVMDEMLEEGGGGHRRDGMVPPKRILLTMDGTDHLFVPPSSPSGASAVEDGKQMSKGDHAHPARPQPRLRTLTFSSTPRPIQIWGSSWSSVRSRSLGGVRTKRAHHNTLDHTKIANANASDLTGLISSKFSNVVYKQDEVRSDFFVLLLIVVVGEFFSAPAITFADCVTLSLLGEDTENYGRQRMFGSLGWGLAMFFVGMALDHATTFPRHPCDIQHPSEKNYTVCFAVFSVMMSCAFLTALLFRFDFHGPGRDIALSELTERVKDKVKKTITGRKKIDRERLVESDDDDNDYTYYNDDTKGRGVVDREDNYAEDRGGRAEGGTGVERPSTNISASHGSASEKQQTGPVAKAASEKLRIKPGLKNDMVTDALRAPGSLAARVSGDSGSGDPYHNTSGTAVPPGQYSTEPFFGKWLAALRLLYSYQYLSVLFVAWFMGFGIGLIFTFLFWHLQDLGGSPTLFGVASVINHISELLAYFMSSKLLVNFGHVKVLYAGLVGNVARFLYISWLRDPYWVLPFEFVQGLTHAAVWAACCAFITQAIPGQLKSSAQGILQALHHGLGRGCGAVFGGLLVYSYGGAVTFRTYGVTCVLVLLAYAGTNYFLQNRGRFSHGAVMEHAPMDDTTHLAPHGVPTSISRELSTSRINPVDNSIQKADYGTTSQDDNRKISHQDGGDPWGGADRYGSTGYDDVHQGRDNLFQESFSQSTERSRDQIFKGNSPRMDTQTYHQQPDNYFDQGYGP